APTTGVGSRGPPGDGDVFGGARGAARSNDLRCVSRPGARLKSSTAAVGFVDIPSRLWCCARSCLGCWSRDIGKGRQMQRKIGFTAALVGLAFVLAGGHRTLRADVKSSVVEIRKELLQLPYYGVFDFLAFSYDKGTVTLMGYAYHSTLKRDAVRA